ncbi:MAG: RHS repeat domain-containing protein [Candidatus Spyradenecus sp.]
MKKLLFGVALGLLTGGVWADMMRNPPCKLDEGQNSASTCDKCPTDGAENGCVHIQINLGRTSVLSDRRTCQLKVFETEASPAIFTPETLNFVMEYTFSHVSDGQTNKNVPREVVFCNALGARLHFRFEDGESLATMIAASTAIRTERLQMVDAEGWATAEDPAYYDLYPGDGSVWRFYATNVTGKLGDLVSYTDARGRVITAEDFGVDVIRASNGLLRQILTASRLTDIVMENDHAYTITVYPFDQKPEMSEGLYVLPQVTPVEAWRIERGGNDAHLLLATQWKGNGNPKTYTYRYVPDVEDWTLTRPNGLVEEKSFYSGDEDNGMQVAIKKSADGQTIYAQKAFYFEDYGWAVGAVAIREALGTDESGKRITEWDYFLSGTNKGKIREKRDWRGNRWVYEYDEKGRMTKETNVAVEHETTYSYAPVDTADVLGEHAGVAAIVSDDRPRCEVNYETLPGTDERVEVSRTYYVYTPMQEIVERAATAGAEYGAAGALRTVKQWYAPDDETPYCAGRLKSIRRENGAIQFYTYRLEAERWIETVTSLHEEAPEPVSGKTMRQSTIYDRVGNVVERNQEAFIDGAWHLIDRTVYEYDIEGHVIKETDFVGRVTTTVWGGNCCGKSSMTLPNGTRFTYTYDDEGRLIAETKLDPLPCTTHYEYDALGRVVKTWKDGLNPETTAYDIFGQVISQTDVRGGVTQTQYSLDGNTVTTTLPNGGTQVRKMDAIGRLLEISGTAVQPQVFTYGPLWECVATGARWEQTERNLLGQTVRQTRSGANGSTLETVLAYDSYGRTSQINAPGQPVQSYAYDATGAQIALTQTVGEVWRKQQSEAEYLLRDSNVWQKQTAVQSCSDVAITPLTQSAYAQVSGLTVSNTFNQITVDVRGNETRTFGNDTQRTTQVPSCTNPQVERYAFGQLVESVGTACVTNRFEYDALDRRVATIDGRNNRTTYVYNAKNNLVSTTDAVGAVTVYGYDVMGQTVSVTNALGNVTTYEYDLRGNKTYEGGATYPVCNSYDVFGNKTSMTTYRNEASGVGDTTTWSYDEASGVLLAKTYADSQGLAYTYTNDGKLAACTNARGVVTTYTYDNWGQLLSVNYTDTTPDVAYVYDAMGHQTSATDAVGTTTFTYDAFGQLTAEQVSGLYSKTLTRHWDNFGRNIGYSVDNERKQSITYHPATGRIAESDDFHWEYLPGTHLKSQLIYPNNDVVTWTYEPHRDLLTAVTNATYSTYTYTNDLLGRRTSKNDEHYGYNVRNELTSADEVSYAYDDIGNRTAAEGKTYTANNLNQYTAIDDFAPQYDADGNQTLIKTETGIWSVIYNAENRPIRWESSDTVVTMSFDRMGRRVEMCTVKEGEETLQHFVYNNYLCIQQLRGAENTLFQSYVWDPTEPIATRPLVFLPTVGGESAYYFHDGNKNVSDLVSYLGNSIHYNYTVFGTATASTFSENPLQFSSEMYDGILGITYYNYRHYHSNIGRWQTRDPLGETVGLNIYAFLDNIPLSRFDRIGLQQQWGDFCNSYLEGYKNDALQQMCAEQARQQQEKAKKDTEALLPAISLTEGVKGSFFIPVPVLYGGIRVELSGSSTIRPCCLNGQLTSYTEHEYSVAIGWQTTWPLPKNKLEPIATINGIFYGPCPPVSSSVDINITATLSVSVAFVTCKYSFVGKRWSCSGGIDLSNLAEVNVSIIGQGTWKTVSIP